MTHPLISSANANLKYNALLKEAEIHNRLKKEKSDRAGWSAAILTGLGDHLVSAGQKLKGQKSSDANIPA